MQVIRIGATFTAVVFYFAFQEELELLGEGDDEGWVRARNYKGEVDNLSLFDCAGCTSDLNLLSSLFDCGDRTSDLVEYGTSGGICAPVLLGDRGSRWRGGETGRASRLHGSPPAPARVLLLLGRLLLHLNRLPPPRTHSRGCHRPLPPVSAGPAESCAPDKILPRALRL